MDIKNKNKHAHILYWIGGLITLVLLVNILYTVPFFTFSSGENHIFTYEEKTILVKDQSVHVEVADKGALRMTGLSGRNTLKENTGMLFVFDTVDKHGIWMKDMRFAIDIIWIDEEGKVVDIKENATPESYPDIFRPQTSAAYVLEVSDGFVQRHKIQIGDSIDL